MSMVTHSTSACGRSITAGWMTNEFAGKLSCDVRSLAQPPEGLAQGCVSDPAERGRTTEACRPDGR